MLQFTPIPFRDSPGPPPSKDFYKKTLNPYNPKKQPGMFFLGNMASGGAAGATGATGATAGASVQAAAEQTRASRAAFLASHRAALERFGAVVPHAPSTGVPAAVAGEQGGHGGCADRARSNHPRGEP